MSKTIDLNKYYSIREQLTMYKNVYPVNIFEIKLLSSKYLSYSFDLSKYGILLNNNSNFKGSVGLLYIYTLSVNLFLYKISETFKKVL